MVRFAQGRHERWWFLGNDNNTIVHSKLDYLIVTPPTVDLSRSYPEANIYQRHSLITAIWEAKSIKIYKD